MRMQNLLIRRELRVAIPSPGPACPTRVRKGFEWVLVAVLAAGMGGCRTASSVPSRLVPLTDAVALAESASDATRPREPTRILFDFRVREADLRFNGRGLARVESPYRIRLDLFSTGGETIFQAALVEGSLRIPPWAPRELAPPPALLWAALGIFRPDPELAFLGGRAGEGRSVTLRYGGEDDLELRFRIREGHLIRAELHRDGHLLEEVDLSLDESTGRVLETVYRNRVLFLELTFSLQSVENVASFPAEIWYPGR